MISYNPSSSGREQTLIQVFPNAEIVQATSPDEVKAAFGPNGAKIKSAYAFGLVIPDHFDNNLLSGSVPVISICFNETIVTALTQALIKIDISNYARSIITPQPR